MEWKVLYLTGLQIKELLRDCQPNKELISLEFDSTKVIVEFRPSLETRPSKLGELDISRETKNLTLNINHHVYVGMKLRGQKELNLYLYNRNEAEKQWSKHQDAVQRVDFQVDLQGDLQVDLPSLDVLEKRAKAERYRQYFGQPEPDHMEKGQVQVQLKGPHHPLEYKLNPVHMVGSQWLVRVEPESVNSVLLDDQPGEVIDQYLVAAHVGLNPSGRALSVRATTLMPNKLCLGKAVDNKV